MPFQFSQTLLDPMAPILLARGNVTVADTSSQLRQQWVNPGDIFSVLLILGGDVIQRALAQLSGTVITPVAFSFGWVAYAISALLSAVGSNKLMPASPEIQCKVINVKSCYARSNQSWVLGRILKDYDHWMPRNVRKRLEELFDEVDKDNRERLKETQGLVKLKKLQKLAREKTTRAGLCVAIFEWVSDTEAEPGVPSHDWVWWSGFAVVAIQLAIAAIPCALFHDWGVLLITVCGSLLAFATGALPQWRQEKWACRTNDTTVALTRGNGSQHAIIIEGSPYGFNLEDLATGEAPDVPHTRVFTCILAVLWFALLITSTGLQNSTWYLLAVGAIGMMQNLIVAGAPRRPEASGLHIQFKEVIAAKKVMHALMDLESSYKGFGEALRAEFFPGNLWEWEKQWWGTSDTNVRKALEEKNRPM
ncbi:MAG: hypothetical protein M1834_007825 [Cirrosporium novae-zelandiae]|nr:MAG: hypothetical protein M1834_007825 [Cirrosporium novae-zelandiae]